MKKIRLSIGLAALAISAVSCAMDIREDYEMCLASETPTQIAFGEAIVNDDVATVESMLKGKQVNPNDMFPWGPNGFRRGNQFHHHEYPLNHVVMLGNMMRNIESVAQRRPKCRQIFELLLKYGADINWQHPRKKDSIIHSLVFLNATDWLEYALEQGGDPALIAKDNYAGVENDSYGMAQTMKDKDCPEPLAVLEKHIEKIKAKVVEAVPALPSGVAGIVARYL